VTTPTTAERLADAELGWPDTIADYIGRYCPTEFPWGADRSAELIMAELVRPLLADLERARSIAVALEQENAQQTERLNLIRQYADGLEDHLPGDAWYLAHTIKQLAADEITVAEVLAEDGGQ
jgi:hypothetical protein